MSVQDNYSPLSGAVCNTVFLVGDVIDDYRWTIRLRKTNKPHCNIIAIDFVKLDVTCYPPSAFLLGELRAAIGWRKASEFHLSTSTEPKCILDPLLPIPLHLPAHSRRNMGLWYSNGLHHLWCCTPHAIPSIILALAVSVVKDNLPNPISFHAEPHL